MTKNIYYIKENIVFSKVNEKIQILEEIELFNFENNKSKNIYIENKTILDKLKKINENIEKNQKELTISGKIKDFVKVKKKILELNQNNKLKNPETTDYEFIEKTSQIEIINQILNSINLDKIKILKNTLNEYIKKISSQENEKYMQLKENLDIENKKLLNIENEKKELEKLNKKSKNEIFNSDKKIEELVELKKQLTSDDGKDEKLVELDEKKKKIILKDEKIKFLIEDNKFEINIIESKILTIKDEIKMGKTKCFNWILIILTLGLIYWTKYSNCKYKIILLNSKKNKIKEKIAKFAKKENQLKRDIEKIIEKEEFCNKNDLKNDLQIKKKLEEINKKIKKEQLKIQENQNLIDENFKKIHKLDSKNEDKIKNRLIELNILKEEYEKYSSKNIEKNIEKIETKIIKQINKLKEIKEKIEMQKIDINGERICEV